MNTWTLHTGARGLRLEVCAWGEPSGRPTVILHGFLEQGAAWDAVARRLPGHIVAPDQRGHGLSEHVGAGGFYHFWDYVSDLDALVGALDAGPVDLVGHSMGGSVACLYAATRPEWVRRLVLVEGLGPPDVTHRALDRGRAFLAQRRDPPRHHPLADLDEAVARMRRFNPDLDPELARRMAARITRPLRPDEDQQAADGALTWTWDPLHRARSPQPFSAQLFLRYLAAIEAPTLVVLGGRSALVLPDQQAREAALPKAQRVVIEDAGHLVHHDRPDALARVIRSHLHDGAP